jgi:hypothetical protein
MVLASQSCPARVCSVPREVTPSRRNPFGKIDPWRIVGEIVSWRSIPAKPGTIDTWHVAMMAALIYNQVLKKDWQPHSESPTS